MDHGLGTLAICEKLLVWVGRKYERDADWPKVIDLSAFIDPFVSRERRYGSSMYIRYHSRAEYKKKTATWSPARNHLSCSHKPEQASTRPPRALLIPENEFRFLGATASLHDILCLTYRL